jgi:hypothetical protein
VAFSVWNFRGDVLEKGVSSLANNRRTSERRAAHAERAASSPDGRLPINAVQSKDINVKALFQIARNVVLRIGRDNLTLVAAGVAFYAMTAIFPAIAAFVSIYGLFADPVAPSAKCAIIWK